MDRAKGPPPGSSESLDGELERTLGYDFAQPNLLAIALTHPSAANPGEPHYERMEFLGDAVLDLAIADLLMRRFPEAKEGALSKDRASIVNGRTLASKAIAVGVARRLSYRRFRTQPVYELVAARGPDHAKRFTTRIRIGGRELGIGEGASKKSSEQAAAREALGQIAHDRAEQS